MINSPSDMTTLLETTLREILRAEYGTTGGAFNVDDAAEYLGMGRTSLYKLMGRGTLIPRSNGVRPVFLRSQLDEYLTSCPVNETPTWIREQNRSS